PLRGGSIKRAQVVLSFLLAASELLRTALGAQQRCDSVRELVRATHDRDRVVPLVERNEIVTDRHGALIPAGINSWAACDHRPDQGSAQNAHRDAAVPNQLAVVGPGAHNPLLSIPDFAGSLPPVPHLVARLLGVRFDLDLPALTCELVQA